MGVSNIIHGLLTARVNLHLISHPHGHHPLAPGWGGSLLVHLPADVLLTNGIPRHLHVFIWLHRTFVISYSQDSTFQLLCRLRMEGGVCLECVMSDHRAASGSVAHSREPLLALRDSHGMPMQGPRVQEQPWAVLSYTWDSLKGVLSGTHWWPGPVPCHHLKRTCSPSPSHGCCHVTFGMATPKCTECDHAAFVSVSCGQWGCSAEWETPVCSISSQPLQPLCPPVSSMLQGCYKGF